LAECVTNIRMLKEFVDRNYEGEKPKLIISTPYNGEDRWFMPIDLQYNQNALDNLKNFGVAPEDSQLSDYALSISFLSGRRLGRG
jgi:hypothetical protein